jgi:hypothetical protein
MSEEVRRILELLASGKVSVDEASRLVEALKEPVPSSETAKNPTANSGPSGRALRITVQKNVTDGVSAKDVDIRIPISLVRGGMRLGAFVPGAGERIAERLRARGIDFDMRDPSKLDELLQNMGEIRIDVDQGRHQVRVRYE